MTGSSHEILFLRSGQFQTRRRLRSVSRTITPPAAATTSAGGAPPSAPTARGPVAGTDLVRASRRRAPPAVLGHSPPRRLHPEPRSRRAAGRIPSYRLRCGRVDLGAPTRGRRMPIRLASDVAAVARGGPGIRVTEPSAPARVPGRSCLGTTRGAPPTTRTTLPALTGIGGNNGRGRAACTGGNWKVRPSLTPLGLRVSSGGRGFFNTRPPVRFLPIPLTSGQLTCCTRPSGRNTTFWPGSTATRTDRAS